jgi:uncharacterized protein
LISVRRASGYVVFHDVGVIVEFDRPLGLAFVDLADELGGILGTRVDLVSRGAINQKVYDFISPDLRYV